MIVRHIPSIDILSAATHGDLLRALANATDAHDVGDPETPLLGDATQRNGALLKKIEQSGPVFATF
jgi:hypothetical protein